MKLVDASVALKWFLQESDFQQARLLAEENDLCAPSLLISEVANGLWKNRNSGTLTDQDARLGLSVLTDYFVEFTNPSVLMNRAIELSLTLNHPAYDCFYLADAERRVRPVITADKRLVEKLKNTPFAHLAEPLGT